MVAKYIDQTIRYRRLQRTIKKIKDGETKMSIAKMSLAIAFPVVRNDTANIMHHSLASHLARSQSSAPNRPSLPDVRYQMKSNLPIAQNGAQTGPNNQVKKIISPREIVSHFLYNLGTDIFIIYLYITKTHTFYIT